MPDRNGNQISGLIMLQSSLNAILRKKYISAWKVFFVGIAIVFMWGCTMPEVENNKDNFVIESTEIEDISSGTSSTEKNTTQITMMNTETTTVVNTEEQLTEHISDEICIDTATIKETVAQAGTKADYDMKVHFLDVGQGLAILVQSEGMNLMYDGGDRETSSYVVSYLKNNGVSTIDYLISSHYDSDHVFGLIGCLSAFEVKNVIASNYEHDSQTYTKFIGAVDKEGLKCMYPYVGTKFTFGTGSFTILGPDSIDGNDSNANSVVIKLTNGDNSFIFTGDAEIGNEEEMIYSGLDLSCDVLVLGHHGSATATSWSFLEHTLPDFAIISAGEGNSYGHPHEETMEKLESMEIDIFRTDKQGEIIATSDGKNIKWNKKSSKDYSSGEEAEEIEETSKKKSESSKNNNSSGSSDKSNNSGEPDNSNVSNNVNQNNKEASGNSEVKVWISETGSKYHSKNDCGTMNPDEAYQMSKDSAQKAGYGPCGRCY